MADYKRVAALKDHMVSKAYEGNQFRMVVPSYEGYSIINALYDASVKNDADGYHATADACRALREALLELNPYLAG